MEKFPGLKLSNVVYTKSNDSALFVFLYNPEQYENTTENQNKVVDFIKNTLQLETKLMTQFTKCTIDEDVITSYTYQTLINNFPAISKMMQISDIKVEIVGNDVKINLKLDPSIYDYATEVNRENDIVNKLCENFYANFVVTFSKKDESSLDFDIQNNLEYQNSIKVFENKNMYEISDIIDVVGKSDFSLATDFSEIERPMEGMVICGNIRFVDKKSYKKTYNSNGESKEIEKHFYTILLANNNKTIYCSVFPRKDQGDLLSSLLPGNSVAMKGKFTIYKDKLNFTADSVCLCVYKKVEAKISYKAANENYHTIFPQEYVDAEQVDLFGNIIESSLKGNYIVFDFETTGLNCSNGDEIIEIGAVKVHNGKIMETFATLVKPSISIPAEATKINNITNDMVKDAPTINLVLPDFFKFCEDSTLVAYNIDFDFGFLALAARKQGYNFDHKQIDAYAMARNNIKGLKNYKLITVAEYFGVDLKDAHRAVEDAVATAKVFVKMAK